MSFFDHVKGASDVVVERVQRIEEALFGEDDDQILPAFPRMMQLDGYSCGAQSAHMVLRYFGKGRSVRQTSRLVRTDENGTSWRPIERLFRARGLRVRVLRRATFATLRAALNAGSAVVVSLDGGAHWGCVYGYGRGRIYLADPSFPFVVRVVTPWRSFRGRWDRWAGVVSHR